jgi:hypothetical protein
MGRDKFAFLFVISIQQHLEMERNESLLCRDLNKLWGRPGVALGSKERRKIISFPSQPAARVVADLPARVVADLPARVAGRYREMVEGSRVEDCCLPREESLTSRGWALKSFFAQVSIHGGMQTSRWKRDGAQSTIS